MILLSHVKQNKTKLSKNCHPHNTIIGSGYIFIWKTTWVRRRAKSMYVYDIKTKKVQVRGTPCKCCNRSQQRSSPGLRLRLTPLLVLMERVWWISHYLITSSALDILRGIWQSTSHTPVEEVAGPDDVCQAVLIAILPSGVLQQLFECLPQSLPDITY